MMVDPAAVNQMRGRHPQAPPPGYHGPAHAAAQQHHNDVMVALLEQQQQRGGGHSSPRGFPPSSANQGARDDLLIKLNDRQSKFQLKL